MTNNKWIKGNKRNTYWYNNNYEIRIIQQNKYKVMIKQTGSNWITYATTKIKSQAIKYARDYMKTH